MQRVVGLGVALFLASSPASAFCGFFVSQSQNGQNGKLSNHASQVALVRQGHHTSLTMSNDYQGPPENFALVVPVPVVLKKEDVKTLPSTVFDHIDGSCAAAGRVLGAGSGAPPPPVYSNRGGRPMAKAAPPSTRGIKDKRDLGVKIEALRRR